MDIEQVRDFTLSLFGVTEDQPFGDDNVTFRVEKARSFFAFGWEASDMRRGTG